MNGLSVVILSRNAANLVPCVRSIREAGETCRIIIVDDGVDWTPSGVRFEQAETFGDWIPISGAKPFVFARNANIGIRAAGIRAAGSDDVILLNDDALLKTPYGFSALHDALLTANAALNSHGEPGYGMLASTCNNVGNPNQEPRTGSTAIRNEIRMLCFVCVLIPRRTINAVGLLDERFVDYGLDDDDYSLRVRKAGLKLGIFDGCYVDHGSLTSSFRGPGGPGGNFHPNMKRFIKKWGVDNWGQLRETSMFKDLFPAKEAESDDPAQL